MTVAPFNTTEWNNRIAFDVALCLEGSGFALDELLDVHKCTQDDLLIWNKDPVFLKQVSSYREDIKEKGLSFRLKARAQAEELLNTSWQLIHDIDVSPTVKADLIKWTAKMGNLDPKPTEGQVDLSGGVKITINLGQNHDETPMKTINAGVSVSGPAPSGT